LLVPVVLVGLVLGGCGDDDAGPATDGATADAGPATDATTTDGAASTVDAPPLDPGLPTSFADATDRPGRRRRQHSNARGPVGSSRIPLR